MKPALDDIFLPCGWAVAAFRDDRIAFTRDENRITLVAEPTDESPSMPELCASHLWRLTCERRVGEARSDITLGCVSTTDSAVETLLRYMRQINEIADSDGGISIGSLLELLRTEAAVDGHDAWGRTASDRLGARPLL